MKKKLFVWENVLWDYGPGIAVAFAEDVFEARRLILEEAEEFERSTLAIDIAGNPDKIHEKAHGVHRWGSS